MNVDVFDVRLRDAFGRRKAAMEVCELLRMVFEAAALERGPARSARNPTAPRRVIGRGLRAK
jgi:hypothetical protein